MGGVTDLGADQKFFFGAATTTAAAVNTTTAPVELNDCDKLAASLEKLATRISDIKAANLQNAEELYSSDEGKVELAARNSEWAQLTAQVQYYETEKTKRSCAKPAPASAPAAAPEETATETAVEAKPEDAMYILPATGDLYQPALADLDKAAVPTHMDSKGEACAECAKNDTAQCYAGDCGDGTGKFCWSNEASAGFTTCSE